MNEAHTARDGGAASKTVRVAACEAVERCVKCGRSASYAVQTGMNTWETACATHVGHLLGGVFYARS